MSTTPSSRWRMVRTVFKHDLSLKVGIIGLGTMGQRMLESMNGHTEFDVRYAWDMNVLQCHKVWSSYPKIQFPRSADELVSFDDIDLIYIATPPSTHVEYSELALEMGKPILCEKPLAVDMQEARSLGGGRKAIRPPQRRQFQLCNGANLQRSEERPRHRTGIGDPLKVDVKLQFAEWPRSWQRNAAGWLAYRQGRRLRKRSLLPLCLPNQQVARRSRCQQLDGCISRRSISRRIEGLTPV